MKEQRSWGWIDTLLGMTAVVVFLLAFTAGQFYVQIHLDSPWREIGLVFSLPFEYLGLSFWSAWMNRELDAPAWIEVHKPPVSPVVLASNEAPGDEAIAEVSRIARESQRPVLLLHLVNRVDAVSWIEHAWTRLAEEGIRVSAQTIFTREPEHTLEEVAAAVGAACVVQGQPWGRSAFQAAS
ncbi:MAG: hypothetical protein JW850_23130 [Thermoflexales bacterium]|nr:hypothetical protein [Thermoflexales bacterium]